MNTFVQRAVRPSGGKKGPVGGASWQRPPARRRPCVPALGKVPRVRCLLAGPEAGPRRAVRIRRRSGSSHRGPGPLCQAGVAAVPGQRAARCSGRTRVPRACPSGARANEEAPPGTP